MRPIPATSLGDAHGLFRAIEKRGRLRTDEFVTEFSLEELFPPGLENALGRLRHFISYGRAAGLVKEDRGVVELTDIGQRYVRAGDADKPYEISAQQAEWLRRQLRELHMTDSIYHGLAIGLSLLASCPPGQRVSTMDFGRSMAYLGRAGWDNENTLEIQGERHLLLLQDMEMIDGDHRVTPTGEQVRGELTLPVHMSLIDIAGQQNPGGAEAVREAAEREWATPVAAPEPEPEPEPEPAAPVTPEEDDDNDYQDVGPGAWAPAAADPSQPPVVPRSGATAESTGPPAMSSGDPLMRFVEQVPPESSVPPPSAAVDAPGGGDGSAGPPPSADVPAAAPGVGAPSADPSAFTPGADERAGAPSVAAPGGDVQAGAPGVGAPSADPPAFAPGADERAGGPSVAVPGGDVPAGAPGVGAPTADAPGVATPSADVPPPAVSAPSAEASFGPPAAAPPSVDPAAIAAVVGGRAAEQAPPVAPPVGAPGVAGAPATSPAAPAFVDAGAIRAAAEASGLRLPDGVYANVAAGLAAGKHLLLTGAPGSGKTTLAMAVARAAAQAGRALGATVVTAAPPQDFLLEAAARGRWVIADELDRADPDEALGPLSSFLAGIPVSFGGEEAKPADGWRIVATWGGAPPRGSVLRRFAVVEVTSPPADQLRAALHDATGGDPNAAHAAERLLPLAEIAPLGAGVFLDAARHAAARRAATPTDDMTLAREAYAAYVAPLLGDLDDDGRRRVRELLG